MFQTFLGLLIILLVEIFLINYVFELDKIKEIINSENNKNVYEITKLSLLFL